MFDAIGNKPLLDRHSQSFLKYVIYNAGEAEKAEFKRRVKYMPTDGVPDSANIVASHTVH